LGRFFTTAASKTNKRHFYLHFGAQFEQLAALFTAKNRLNRFHQEKLQHQALECCKTYAGCWNLPTLGVLVFLLSALGRKISKGKKKQQAAKQ